MKMYEARAYGNLIEEKEYERVTASFAIKANGRRESLDNEYGVLRPTLEEAVAWRRAHLERKMEVAKRNVELQQAVIAEFEEQYGKPK